MDTKRYKTRQYNSFLINRVFSVLTVSKGSCFLFEMVLVNPTIVKHNSKHNLDFALLSCPP